MDIVPSPWEDILAEDTIPFTHSWILGQGSPPFHMSLRPKASFLSAESRAEVCPLLI